MSEQAAHVPGTTRRRLRGISEIRSFFRTNTSPVYFFGPTAFNLLGIDRWARNFSYVVYYDSWDGAHPRVFSPKSKPPVEFGSSEDVTKYLLRDPEVQAFIAAKGGRPKVAMVFLDEETERICAELGYELVLPSDALRRRLDSKIVTTVLGNEAGAPSVPNVLTEVDSWGTLVRVATGAGLGTDLVVQTPYGDSGKTTFFISSESDWATCADDILGQQAKVMKRINNKAAAVEAVLTRHGTIVGPFMTDLTGYPELTPYRGGWCGNDLFPGALSDEHYTRAVELVRRLGGRLGQEGYVGFFEVDVLVDLDTGEVYLGELNPRISGASSMTNVTAGAYADLPLFLFHLLEYMDVDYDARRRRARRALARAGGGRRLGAADHEGAERLRRAHPRRTADGHLPPPRGRLPGVPPRVPRLARPQERERVLLPARLRTGRLPLQGRGPGDPRHQGPHADRRGADAAVSAVHQGHPGHVRQRAPDPAAGRHAGGGREVAQRPLGPSSQT